MKMLSVAPVFARAHRLGEGQPDRLGLRRPGEVRLVTLQVRGRLSVGEHDHLSLGARVLGEQASGHQERVLHVGAVRALEPRGGEIAPARASARSR